ncbi:MAG: exo-1,3-beta-glucanase [Trizodia sp. TS-e1964]|nr:MAG: exo-1,3-beta-glucanase [Trizodia sp. TS-e1964]
MFSKAAILLALSCAIVDAAPITARDCLTYICFLPSRRAPNFQYGSTKVRGVNLGGWFVLEPWITPSLFEAGPQGAVDEYTYTQLLGKDEAFTRLTQHWSTWITQADFASIATAGLNHVRIPIGYWAVAPLDGDPYVQGQLAYLDEAIGWARNVGLKVMLDLHGAPGSQNGFDNSGRYGSINWQQGDTVLQTKNAVTALARRYASQTDVVTSIELLNEPFGPALNMDIVKQFYYDGWGTIRDSGHNTAVTIHDAFEGAQYWNGFMAPPTAIDFVILDIHQYQVFSPGEVARNPADHVSAACNIGRTTLRDIDKWTIVGEWSGAETDCAKWLNGRFKGARYDGTFPQSYYVGDCNTKHAGKVADLPQADKDNLQHYIEAQLDAYEQGAGWMFWTWKTEGAPEWDMHDLLANGLFPQPLTSRRCKFSLDDSL